MNVQKKQQVEIPMERCKAYRKDGEILRAWVDDKNGIHLSRSDMSRWIGIENPCSIKLKSARAFDSVSKDTVIPMAEAMDYLEKKSTKVRARTLAKGIREHSFHRSESAEESAREDVEVASMNVIRRKRKRERRAKSIESEKSVPKSSKRGDGDEERAKKRRKDRGERKRIEKRRKLARKQIEEMEELLSRTPSSSRSSSSSNSNSSEEEGDELERRHKKGKGKEEGSEEEMEIDEEEEEEEEEEEGERAEKAESGSESGRAGPKKGCKAKAGGKAKGKGREEAPPGKVKGKGVTKIDERAKPEIPKPKHKTTTKDDHSSKHGSFIVPSKGKEFGKGKGSGKGFGKEKGDRWEPIRVIEDKRDASPSSTIPKGKKRRHSSMEVSAKEVGNGTIAPPPPPSPRPIKKTRSGEITDYDKLLELRIQSLEDDIHIKNETIKTLNMVLRKIVRGKGDAKGSEASNAPESGEGTIEPDTERAGEDGYEDDAKEKVDGGS